MDPNSINVPEIISEGRINDEKTVIREMEDMIAKVYDSGKSSKIIANPFVFIWKIPDEYIDHFPDLSVFGIDIKNVRDIAFMGPIVRSCLKLPHNIENYQIRRELYLYRYTDIEWENLLDIKRFRKAKGFYIFDHNAIKVYLIRKKLKSPANIVLQNEYNKRLCYLNGEFYGSSMFLIEYDKYMNDESSKIVDPVFKRPKDILEIFTSPRETVSITSAIDKVDLNSLMNFQCNYNDLNNGFTMMELVLKKITTETNPILIDHLKQMVVFLMAEMYIRPPFLYSKMLDINNTYQDIYSLLSSSVNKYGIKDSDFKPNSMNDIDNYIINFLIINDMKEFYEYTDYIKLESIPDSLIDNMIEYKSINIIKKGANNNKLNSDQMYKCFLMLEDFDLIRYFDEIDVNKAIIYLPEIISKGLFKSYYFIAKHDINIVNKYFDNNDTALHKLTENGNYKDLLQLIMNLNENLLEVQNDQNETPLMTLSRKSSLLTRILLDYEPETTIVDINGNTILHNLCINGDIETIKYICKTYPQLVNVQNKNLETPIIIAAINKHEDAIYTLKGLRADMDKKDRYGNTVYHYICQNSLCLGMIINDTVNEFGFSTQDYCRVAKIFYHFIGNV